MSATKFEGTIVRMGERDVVIPPFTFRQLKDTGLRAKLETMGTIGVNPSTEQLDAARDVIHACLARNYPDLSIETLDEMITMGNLSQCMRAIFGIPAPAGGVAAVT